MTKNASEMIEENMMKIFTEGVVWNFRHSVDFNRSYDIEELVDILRNVYAEKYEIIQEKIHNAKSNEKYKELVNKREKAVSTKSTKRAPTAYNNYMSITLRKIKDDEPSLSAKDAMAKVASLWKEMTKEQKDEYKTKR